jgi:hypothetical protein
MATMITQHRLNALHVFCRMRDLGMPAGMAKPMARFYERVINPWLYRLGGSKEKEGARKEKKQTAQENHYRERIEAPAHEQENHPGLRA